MPKPYRLPAILNIERKHKIRIVFLFALVMFLLFAFTAITIPFVHKAFAAPQDEPNPLMLRIGAWPSELVRSEPQPPHDGPFCPTADEIEVAELINQERMDACLPRLSIEVRLVEAARLHSEDMAANDFVEHTGSDGSTVPERFIRAGYDQYTAWAENIAAGYLTPALVVSGWMDSPGHSANILSTTVEHIGVGYAYDAGSTYGHYWTANFGRATDAGQPPPLSCGVSTFIDVPVDQWAWRWIEAAYNNGVTSGCASEPRAYCPDDEVSRAQMAKFILVAEHGLCYEPPSGSGSLFDDVSEGHWAVDWVEELANEGITSGCAPNLYCPDLPVSRAQMAKFLLLGEHGSGYTPPAGTGSMFADVPAGHAFVDWVEQLAAEGVTSGCGGGNYCPDLPVSRAQMAVFLVQTFDLNIP